ncbi:hypothetical protein [Pseudoalteromonas sp. T1lg22]|uniref:hypothetical protein n=1 Tax=Pseudoalteromonas sp. T1lg22 TaxID=2077096 RepID=UPI000CF65E09|nr:hypothetical protein [Pseudoalteromonas sp. T1lg22]
MQKALILALGVIFLCGCVNTTSNDAAGKSATIMLASDMTNVPVQPFNIEKDCLIYINNTSDHFEYLNNSRLRWDGDCKNGKANGLGKILDSSGPVDRYDITFLRKGIPEQLSISGLEGEVLLIFRK